jgi:hypothetical protein
MWGDKIVVVVHLYWVLAFQVLQMQQPLTGLLRDIAMAL